jgi:prevent-host-death family protein
MTTVGAYEAKTHLPELLARVAKGERIMIARRGKPAALLVPPPAQENQDVQQVSEEMKELRRGNVLGDLSIRDLIEQGRRY